jgi:hypothetical protein
MIRQLKREDAALVIQPATEGRAVANLANTSVTLVRN